LLVIGEGTTGYEEPGGLEQMSANDVHVSAPSKKPPARENRGP
jgi:hypothetical protein